MQSFYPAVPQGIKLFIRLTPGSSTDKIQGIYEDEQQTYLKISVTSPPEEGKANKNLIAFLSKHLKIPKTKIQLLTGHTSRYKTLLLEGMEENKIRDIL